MDNNKGKAKLKKTKMKRPLSNNIEQYIYSHGLTNQEFADQLNEYLQKQYPDFEVIYTANSIWAITSRETENYIGSVPRDPRALDAFASITGKSLDELMRKYLSMEDFVNNMPVTENSNNVNNDNAQATEKYVPPHFDLKAFFDLRDDVIELVFYLLDDVQEEDGQLVTNLKIGIRADGRNRKIEYIYYLATEYITGAFIMPDSNNFQSNVREFFDYDIDSVEEMYMDDFCMFLYDVGFLANTECTCASMTDLPDYEEYAYLSGYYNLKITLNIDKVTIELLRLLNKLGKESLKEDFKDLFDLVCDEITKRQGTKHHDKN